MATSGGAFDSARDTYDMVKAVGLEVGDDLVIDLLQKSAAGAEPGSSTSGAARIAMETRPYDGGV